MTTRNRRAAEMAATWWADRLVPDEPRERFRKILADLVEDALDAGGSVDLVCDYDPWNLLLDAVRAAGIECSGYLCSADGILPRKHTLYVTPTRLEPKEGYGNWKPPIPVKETDDDA